MSGVIRLATTDYGAMVALGPALALGASESTLHERDASMVAELWEAYPVTDRDVLVIISNSGRNPAPVELALQARQRNIRTIALHNAAHSQAFESRHVSGKRLGEVAELTHADVHLVRRRKLLAERNARLVESLLRSANQLSGDTSGTWAGLVGLLEQRGAF